jgi:phosphate uptake regulator
MQLLKHGAQVQASYKNILIRLHGQVTTAASDATHILLVAKNLEQTADMAIEIMKIGHYVNFGTKYEKNKLAD